MPSSDIKIRSFTGQSISPYLSSIARLRTEIFQDYPYLSHRDVEKEMRSLKRYTQSHDSIAVLIFDGSLIVGAAIGIPLELESKELQKPFLKQGLKPSSYFYFGESALLKQYRRRGIGHHFFDLRESHASQLKRFDHICFYAVKREEDHPKKPLDFMPLNDFWRKRGYLPHPQIHFFSSWKDLNEEQKSEKKMVLWFKELCRG